MLKKRDEEIGGGQDRFYADSNTVARPIIDRAKGIYMWDQMGNDYIDVCSGPMVSGIGHCNEAVVDAMMAQARKMDYAFTQVAKNQPNIDYTDRLAKLAGPGFERVSLVSGGSEAVENGIKFLRQYAVATGRPEKTKVITLAPSYHGATIATLGMSGVTNNAPFLEGFTTVSEKIPAPLGYRLPDGFTRESYAWYCADMLEQKILELGPENVLAFMIEPVGGLTSGCNVPTDEYIYRIRKICTQYGVYLVFDEVLCGAGRTGKFLAAHHWPDALPDVILMAKALGAGYAPLGAMFASAEMVEELNRLTGFEFSYSYNANPIACAAGNAVLDVYEEGDLFQKAAEKGLYLRAGLEALMDRFSFIGEVRGMGMLLGVEIVADKQSKAILPDAIKPTELIRKHGLKNGLMMYARPTSNGQYGHWFTVAPPLNITTEECDELLTRLDATLTDFAAELIALT